MILTSNRLVNPRRCLGEAELGKGTTYVLIQLPLDHTGGSWEAEEWLLCL
jgi:hypothetical protein